MASNGPYQNKSASPKNESSNLSGYDPDRKSQVFASIHKEASPAYRRSPIISTSVTKNYDCDSALYSKEKNLSPYNKVSPKYTKEKDLSNYSYYFHKDKEDCLLKSNPNQEEKRAKEKRLKLNDIEIKNSELIRENKMLKDSSERNLARFQDIINMKDRNIIELEQSNQKYLNILNEKDDQEHRQKRFLAKLSPERLLNFTRGHHEGEEEVFINNNLQSKKRNLSEYKAKILILENNIERLAGINKNIKKENKKLNEKNYNLEVENKKYQRLCKELECDSNLRGRLKSCDCKKQMEYKLIQIFKEKEQFESLLEESEYKFKELEEKVKFYDRKIAKFDIFLSRLKENVGADEHVEDYDRVLQQVKNKIYGIGRECELIEENIPGLQRNFETLDQDLYQAFDEIIKLNEENKNLKQNEKLCLDIIWLLELNEKFKANSNNFYHLKEEILKLKKNSEENIKLTDTIINIQDQLNELQQKLIKKKSRIQNLKSKIQIFEDRFSRSEDIIQTKADEINSQEKEIKSKVEESMQIIMEKFKNEAKINEENLKQQYELDKLKLKLQYTDMRCELQNDRDEKKKQIELLNWQLFDSRKELDSIKEENRICIENVMVLRNILESEGANLRNSILKVKDELQNSNLDIEVQKFIDLLISKNETFYLEIEAKSKDTSELEGQLQELGLGQIYDLVENLKNLCNLAEQPDKSKGEFNELLLKSQDAENGRNLCKTPRVFNENINIFSLKTEFKILIEKINSIVIENKDLKIINEELENEIKKLNDIEKVPNYKENLSNNKEAQIDEKINKFEIQNENLETEVNNSSTFLGSIKAKLTKLEEELVIQNLKNEDLQKDNNHFESQYYKVKAELDEVQKALTILNDKNLNLIKKCEELEGKAKYLKDYQVRSEYFEKLYNEVNSELIDKTILFKEINKEDETRLNTSKNKYEDLEKLYISINEELMIKENKHNEELKVNELKLNELSDKYRDCEIEIETLKKKINDKNSNISELEKIHNDLNFNQLLEEFKKLEAKNIKLKERLSVFEKYNSDLREKLLKKNSQIEDLKLKNENLRNR